MGQQLRIVLIALAALLALAPAAPAAEPPPVLWTKGENCGSGAISGTCGFEAIEDPSGLRLVETNIPRGIGVDPLNGHLYVADQINQRIVELTAFGDFVKAWGWGVRDGTPEPQTCTAQTGCLRGLEGAGPGQFHSPQGVAVDSMGGIYVVDRSNNRVQKFNRDGEFLLMFGGEVNKTKVEEGAAEALRNRCPVDPGDVCQAGTTGTGQGQFEEWPFSSFIAVGFGDVVHVGDKGRVQRFDTDGESLGISPDPEEVLSGKRVQALAVDSGGRVYLGLEGEKVARVLDSGGNQVCSAGLVTESENSKGVRAIAPIPSGGFYVVNDPPNFGIPEFEPRILQFDGACQRVDLAPEDEERTGFGETELTDSTGIAVAQSPCYEAPAFGLYVANLTHGDSFIRAYGSAPGKLDGEGDPVCPPPSVPPGVEAQYSIEVGAEEATLGARINPHFFADTAYRVEFGTAPCSLGGCTSVPAAPGTPLGAGTVEKGIEIPGIALEGLSPGTTYHYRFLATSGGGGAAGPEKTFSTYPAAGAAGACPNAAFRAGPAAALPDCRAYELVSPVDKGGGDVAVRLGVVSAGPALLNQAADSGEAITYSSYRAFADPEAAPFTSQYLARRIAGQGWQSESLAPPQEGEESNFESKLEIPFKAFSPDLEESWLYTTTEPLLAPGAIEGFANLYRRDADGGYEACTTATPNTDRRAYQPNFQGFAGQTGYFYAFAKLTAEANDLEGAEPLTNRQLYLCREGQLRLVGVLPDGSANRTESTLGTGLGFASPASSIHLDGALSSDGTRAFWTANVEAVGGAHGGIFEAGHVYLRLNPAEPESPRENGSASGTGDLIGPASGEGNLTGGSKTIAALTTQSGAFAVGQEITAPAGIPPGTTVTSVSATSLKISNAATAKVEGAALTGLASEVVGGLVTESGAFQAGQNISGPGIPTGATIISCAPACGPTATSLTLSAKATASATGALLSATSPCTEAETKACTLPVSELATSDQSRYWAATPSGSKALFAVEKGPQSGNLYLYDTEEALSEADPLTLLAEGTQGVLGTSEDLSRIYFLSSEEIDGEGEAGEPNLYLYESGSPPSTAFIATLGKADAEPREQFSPVNRVPIGHTARVTPGGEALAFTSSSPELAELVAGFDNTETATGDPLVEVYLYEIGSDDLACVSCARSGQRPQGRPLPDPSTGGTSPLRAAAVLPPSQNSLFAPRVLSADGERLYFDSYTPLLPADTNGKADVYQWEAPGKGSCSEASSAYNPKTGGCLALISSGKDEADSQFVDASPDGEDVFFTTAEGLVPQDGVAIDLYDARVGGGFPAPAEPGVECEPGGCREADPPPPLPAPPASSTFQGPGNQVRKPKPCPKGKKKVVRKGKVRCVKPKPKKSRKANHHQKGARR